MQIVDASKHIQACDPEIVEHATLCRLEKMKSLQESGGFHKNNQ